MLGIKIDYGKRIYGFDLLRAFAIVFVVHGHGRHLLRGTLLEGFPWFYLPHGVDIFFVLSGFLIGYSFITNTAKARGKLGGGKMLNFWERSILRILPNYYLILAANYFLVNSGIMSGSAEKISMLKFATFTQNLYYPFYDFFWESWSLAVQEWFYWLFPVLLFLMVRAVGLKRGIVAISLFFILLSIIYRISISGQTYDSFWWGVHFRKVVASRIDTIFFGVLMAWIRYFYQGLWRKYAVHSFVAGMALFLFTAYFPRPLNTFYTNVLFLSLSGIAIALWFPLIDKLKNVKGAFGKFMSHISILSYAMYLLNLMIIQIIDKNFPEFIALETPLKYALFWAVTLMASYLLHVLYENPISSYGNKVLHTTRMMYKRVRYNGK